MESPYPLTDLRVQKLSPQGRWRPVPLLEGGPTLKRLGVLAPRPLLLVVLDGHSEVDVGPGHHHERRALDVLRFVAGSDGGVLEGEELAVALVQVVREPAAVALLGERDIAGYAVEVRLADDALASLVHRPRDAIARSVG